MIGASRLARRRWLTLALAVTCALLSLGGLALSTMVKSPAQLAAETGPPPASLLTEAVERRVVASTIVTRAAVVSARTVEATPSGRQGETALVTAVHRGVGTEVRPGDVPVEVSGRPLIVLAGAVPAYRDLRPDDEGNDVAMLQSALRSLGLYSGRDRRGYFGSATKQAVAALYARVGYRVPTTGGGTDKDGDALAGGQSVVQEKQRAVDELLRKIAVQPSPDPSRPPSAEEPLTEQLLRARAELDRAKAALAKLIARTGPMLPAGEALFLSGFPARVVQSRAKVGEIVQAPLITLSTGQLAFEAKLRPDQAILIKVGMPAEVVAESLRTTVTAAITDIGQVTTDTPAAGGAATPAYLPVRLTPAQPLPLTWSGQNVRLTITSAQTPDPVLVVPLSAVSAASDGKTSVSKIGPDQTVIRVPVIAGASGDGYVEVTPAVGGALGAGDRVVIGR